MNYLNGDIRRFKDNPEAFAVYLNGVWLDYSYTNEIIHSVDTGKAIYKTTYPRKAVVSEEQLEDMAPTLDIEYIKQANDHPMMMDDIHPTEYTLKIVSCEEDKECTS